MISSLTLQDRTDYPTYYTSYTSYGSNSHSGATNSNYYTSAVTISDGVSITVFKQSANANGFSFADSFGGYSAVGAAEGGTTYSNNATMQSYSQSFSESSFFVGSDSDGSTTSSTSFTASSGSSFTTGFSIFDTFITQQVTDYTYNRTTTADAPVTTTHYIVSGSGALTTDTKAVTVKSTTYDAAAGTSYFDVSTTF